MFLGAVASPPPTVDEMDGVSGSGDTTLPEGWKCTGSELIGSTVTSHGLAWNIPNLRGFRTFRKQESCSNSYSFLDVEKSAGWTGPFSPAKALTLACPAWVVRSWPALLSQLLGSVWGSTVSCAPHSWLNTVGA